MSTEQERIDAHRAAVMAWAHRIPAVLASPDAARRLALGVVAELLWIFVPKPREDAFGKSLERVRAVYERAVWGEDVAAVRAAADHLGSVLLPRDAPGWTWETRAPYEVCEALRRACADSLSLCGEEGDLVACETCDGKGEITDPKHPMHPRNTGDGEGETWCLDCEDGMVRAEPLVPPILALLLHDAAALLVDLRADLEGFESLVREAERRERGRTRGSEGR